MKKIIRKQIDAISEIKKMLSEVQQEIKDVHSLDSNSYKLGTADGLSMALEFLKCHNDKIN